MYIFLILVLIIILYKNYRLLSSIDLMLDSLLNISFQEKVDDDFKEVLEDDDILHY